MKAEVGLAESPEVEVLASAVRRRFTARYKLRVLREADGCTRPGEVGALLRREGLYSSHLAAWRAARERGALRELSSKKRSPKSKPKDARQRRIAHLEREVKRLRTRAERAEALVEVQKKLSELLGIELPSSNGR